MSKVVTRFAPSPTGFIHVGGIRTALFAWLLAKHNNGTFILRLEDTDQAREVAGADIHIMKSLKVLGLEYNEGPDIGGPNGPYRQSQKLIIYAEWGKKLIDQGMAYADPYTKEELDKFRQEAQQQKKPFLFRNHRPKNPPKWDGSQPLRFKSNPKSYSWHDAVMGDLNTGPEIVDDIILIKSDGFPTYNFAHIIDDYLMGITHIVRGQEFISSMPNYLNLYDALGITWPIFATLPHILGPDGNKKLSKRDGAKDVLDYLKDGYLQETLINFIASLGWNDGTEQEIYSQTELIEKFDLSQVQKSPARFDEKRLLWMNGQWIRSLGITDLLARLEPYWSSDAKKAEANFRYKIAELVQGRLKTLADLQSLTNFFFTEPTPDMSMISDNKQLKNLSSKQLTDLLQSLYNSLKITDFDSQSIQDTLNNLLFTTGQKPMVLFSLLRIATTWAPFSPDLAPSLALLGKQTVLERIASAQKIIV